MYNSLEQISNAKKIIFSDKEKLMKDIIINIFNGKFYNNNTSYDYMTLYYIGQYYQYIQINYSMMEKYYWMSIDKANITVKYILLYIENYDILKNQLEINQHCSNIMNCLGSYYMNIEKDYIKMKQYYMMAIEKGNTNSMNNIASYYMNIEKDYNMMETYYKMSIKKGNIDALNKLGLYYMHIKDYENMKKYLLLAIEKGNIDATSKLGSYYLHIKDYVNMKKYYTLAIVKGNIHAMNRLGSYYQYIEKDYKMMEKYYTMFLEKATFKNDNDYIVVIYNIGVHSQYIKKDYDNMKNCYKIAIENNNTNAMYNIGMYYIEVENNYNMMKKYFIMGLDKGHIEANKKLDFYENIISKFKKTYSTEECIVCYNMDDMYYTRCNVHSICVNCMLKLHDKPCPMCRI
jgi:TPR repeat protein